MVQRWKTLMEIKKQNASLINIMKGKKRKKDVKCFFFFFFCLHHVDCRILVPGSGMEPRPSAVRAQNLNHWTYREFP